jgi:hypothetical protein
VQRGGSANQNRIYLRTAEQFLPVSEGSRPARQPCGFRPAGGHWIGNRNYPGAAHSPQRAKMNAAHHLAATNHSQLDEVHAYLVVESALYLRCDVP